VNLHNEGGGLMLSTDHNVYANDGANDIAALIGLDPFIGNFGGAFPVDTANPLMNTPNLLTSLYNDSSTSQAPFGLQPNGIVLDAVGFHSGNPQNPGISSTIDGSLNMVLAIEAPVDGTVLCSGESVLATTSVTGNTGLVTYAWSSDLDGALGTGDTLVLAADSLSDGIHTITVLATDSTGLVDDADITVEIRRRRLPLRRVRRGHRRPGRTAGHRRRRRRRRVRPLPLGSERRLPRPGR